MVFTRYSQLSLYLTHINIKMADQLEIVDDHYIALSPRSITLDDVTNTLQDKTFDVIMCRFSLRYVTDVFGLLTTLVRHLKPQGYIVIQDFLMPAVQRDADYINALLHLLDKKHQQAFAQYIWDGLLLDSGVTIQQHDIQAVTMNLQHPSAQGIRHLTFSQHIQVMLLQAPDAVQKYLSLRYAGTPYAEFTLQEMVIIGQKET